jgi:hypothetical protein
MLFDLRSRGRRRTVQVIYLGLALIMLGGLVLFGVGAGNGFGGLLDAFTNSGSGNNQNQAVTQQTKAAEKQVRLHPDSASAWSALTLADWTAARSAGAYNSTTGVYSATGKRLLHKTVSDWQRYLQLVKKPDPSVAILAAGAYGQLADYTGEASAWEQVTLVEPTASRGYICLAASAYAAKQNRKGDLAKQKALTMVPTLQRKTLSQQLNAAKTTPTIAQQC